MRLDCFAFRIWRFFEVADARNDGWGRGDRAEKRGIMGREKCGWVYILFNKRNGTLYTGVTSDLVKRMYMHKNKVSEGFMSQHGVDKLGYYKQFDGVVSAIEREKQIKGGSRRQKVALIESVNPGWEDLFDTIV